LMANTIKPNNLSLSLSLSLSLHGAPFFHVMMY
jgi:hypothetical protein